MTSVCTDWQRPETCGEGYKVGKVYEAVGIMNPNMHGTSPTTNVCSVSYLTCSVYRVAQKSVNWLVKHTLKYTVEFLYYVLNLQKFIEISTWVSESETVRYEC